MKKYIEKSVIRHNNTYPKARVKRVFKKVINDGIPVTVAMRKEGYAEATINNPQNVTESKAWQQLLEKYIPDSKLTKVLDEGLKADKVISATVFPDGKDGKPINDFIEVPDYPTRHKYLDTGLKLKNKFPTEPFNPESETGLKNLIIIVNNILDGQSRKIIKDI